MAKAPFVIRETIFGKIIANAGPNAEWVAVIRAGGIFCAIPEYLEVDCHSRPQWLPINNHKYDNKDKNINFAITVNGKLILKLYFAAQHC